MTADAQLYRAELWAAIGRASGFDKSFAGWWVTRPVKLQASPRTISRLVPTLDQCQAIFTDFEHNYRRLETWHLRKRRELLAATFQHQQDRLFSMVKPEAKQPLRHLEQVHLFNVLAVNSDQTQIQLDATPSLSEHTTCFLDGQQVDATLLDEGLVQIAHDSLFLQPHTFEVQEVITDTPAMLAQLETFWSARWWKQPLPADSDWERMFAFADAYLPYHPLPHRPIEVAHWVEINKRYGPSAARGPDGVDRRDLQWMPSDFQSELVALLNRFEHEGSWPPQLLPGFVRPLPKREEGARINDFRPVIIYAMVYRSWSSLRARSFLKHISEIASGTDRVRGPAESAIGGLCFRCGQSF